MAILFLLRAVFTILSVALIVAALVLLGDWHAGDYVRGTDGVLRLHRAPWELWTGVGLIAWSLLGRFPMLLLLARKGSDPMLRTRQTGRMLESSTGAMLYVEETGSTSATPLILTHGWSMDSTIWHYAKRDLAQRFEVFAWDLPGLGRSKRAGSEVSLSRFAQDLKAVIEQTGERRPILIGHSIGGMIIETLARDDPAFFTDRVAGVALLNTTYTNPLRTMVLSRVLRALRKVLIVPMLYLQIWLSPLVWLLQWQSYWSGSQHLAARFGFGRSVTRSQLDHTALLMTRNSPAVLAHGDLAMLRWDASDALPRISVPTLVVGGDIDIVTKLEASEEMARRIDRAVLKVVAGANHMGPVDRHDDYHQAIIAFARSA